MERILYREVIEGGEVLETSAGRELRAFYPSLIASLSEWLTQAKDRVPDPDVLPPNFGIYNMPWGDQSYVHRLFIQPGPAAGVYVLKERQKASEISQPYTNELLQTQQIQTHLGPELKSLDINFQEFMFATSDICLVRSAAGQTPPWRLVQERLTRFHNLLLDYILQQQQSGEVLWKNVYPDILDSQKRPKHMDFLLDNDGITLVSVDPFVYAENPSSLNFYTKRVEERS